MGINFTPLFNEPLRGIPAATAKPTLPISFTLPDYVKGAKLEWAPYDQSKPYPPPGTAYKTTLQGQKFEKNSIICFRLLDKNGNVVISFRIFNFGTSVAKAVFKYPGGGPGTDACYGFYPVDLAVSSNKLSFPKLPAKQFVSNQLPFGFTLVWRNPNEPLFKPVTAGMMLKTGFDVVFGIVGPTGKMISVFRVEQFGSFCAFKRPDPKTFHPERGIIHKNQVSLQLVS